MKHSKQTIFQTIYVLMTLVISFQEFTQTMNLIISKLVLKAKKTQMKLKLKKFFIKMNVA